MQRPAGDLQMGQPGSLSVPGHFEHPGAELRRIFGHRAIFRQSLQQRVHTLQLQRRAEKAGEYLPPPDHLHQIIPLQTSGLQVPLQHAFIAYGSVLLQRRRPKIHTPLGQPPAQLGEHVLPVCPREIHLVDKQKDRHVIAFQQLPKGPGMPLDAVRAADHQHRTVQYPQGALRLRRKIHMARGIQQRQFPLSHGQHCLLGKNRDSPLPLHSVCIQKRVSVVHPSQTPQNAAAVEQRLRQGGLSRVHVGQYSNDQLVHATPPMHSYPAADIKARVISQTVSYHFRARRRRALGTLHRFLCKS